MGRRDQASPLPGMSQLNVTAFPDQAVEMIEDLIAIGQLRGGDRLTEQRLSESLGVSRTPLREAIKILAARGLVRVRPNAGAVVSLPNETEARQLVEVMGWLWEKLAYLVVRNIDMESEREIARLHGMMCELNDEGDMLEWAKINRRFHEQIIRASRNDIACEMAINLQMRIYLCFAIGQRSVARQKQANEEHAQIVDAIRARDGDRLAKMLSGHTRKAFQTAYETGVISRTEDNG